MKVLAKGRKQTGWSKKATCTGRGNGDGGCGAKLLVEEPDLYLTHSSHYDGSNETYVTFRCCECGVQTDIEGVPGPIVGELRSSSGKRAG